MKTEEKDKKEMIFDIIKAVLIEDGIDEKIIKKESKINEDIGFDSLDAIEYLMEIEEILGQELADFKPEEFNTIGDVVNKLDSLTNEKKISEIWNKWFTNKG